MPIENWALHWKLAFLLIGLAILAGVLILVRFSWPRLLRHVKRPRPLLPGLSSDPTGRRLREQ